MATDQKPGGAAGGGSAGDIPAGYMTLYRAAAGTCPKLDWALLAGIGKVETNHGRADLPGVRSGSNSAGAKGPMQFLGPTFAAVRKRHPDVGSDVYDPADAIPAAAHYLCDSGLRDGSEYRAIFAYNRAGWYVAKVRGQAAAYRAAA
ncbi:transglycosylase SLT domain-containing protein [Amycolatopsis nigrescens]|uniref:transglycosylase SLT domain-containing protein n=1 Tax=Amycolatopsis nigrescens TaxID=381445 RepID=UPI00316AD750